MILKVLIVEDSLIMRNKLKLYIENMNHEVIFIAKNGEEGISAAIKLKPDVITMDINMPNTNGIEAVSRIKSERFDVDIIMVTAIGQEKIVMAALSAGAMGYLLKPIEEEKISKIFSDICKKRKEKGK